MKSFISIVQNKSLNEIYLRQSGLSSEDRWTCYFSVKWNEIFPGNFSKWAAYFLDWTATEG